MYDTIRKHLGTRIAELGAGRGNLSKFLKQGANVLVTDNRETYLEELREKWGHFIAGCITLNVRMLTKLCLFMV